MYRSILLEELKVQKSSGYFYFIDKYHPMAIGAANYVYYHRHVASIKLGRWLNTEEQVHHIDRIKSNNDPSNLEIMSAVEHGLKHQIEDFGNKPLLHIKCNNCNLLFKAKYQTVKFCSVKCWQVKSAKLNGLTKEELEYLIWTNSFVSLAKLLNCSDNGVRGWAKRLGCIMPPSRFHSRNYSFDEKLKTYNDTKDL